MIRGFLRQGWRSVLDLVLSFAIGFVLLIISIFVNLLEGARGFLIEYSRLRITRCLINLLLGWLAALLWLAFYRWREAVRKRNELENILASISPDALLVLRPDRRIVMCNASVQRIFGYSEKEVLGQTTDLLYFDRRSSKSRPHEIYEALEKDGFHIGTAVGKKKGGGTVPLEIISGELKGTGGAVLLLRDISQRVRLEEERNRLEKQAQRTEKLEILGALAAGVGRNFNNSVMVIQGHTDLMLAGNTLPPAVRERVEEINRACARAAALCQKLALFAGTEAAEFRPLDLTQIVRETVQVMGVSIPDVVRVKTEFTDNLPLFMGDLTQVQQIVMNLITNAVEALDKGGGEISLSTGAQDVDQRYIFECAFTENLQPGRYVYFQVTDTGCGIAEDVQNKIFDPFFSSKPSGHGMGLATVVALLRRHRGAIHFTSAPRKGSTFTVLFPVVGTGTADSSSQPSLSSLATGAR